jgi:hypothetical protein
MGWIGLSRNVWGGFEDEGFENFKKEVLANKLPAQTRLGWRRGRNSGTSNTTRREGRAYS